MIAHWMLYCLAVGALLSLGALATERAMRAFALPQRWVWAVAMVGMLALPAAVRWMPRAAEPAPSTAAQSGDEGTPIRTTELAGGGEAEPKPRIDIAALDRPLVIGWMGMTAAALLALIAAWAVLERRRRGWRAAEVDGVPVLLSPTTGPAVIGLFRSRIVLPQWVVADASDDVRALLLEHEREHLRAGDPKLLALGLAVVALMPWNPAAWWQLRRLRLAVEVDCDARVLARRADVRAYGTLLLEVGRRGTGGRLLAAAFSEPTSFLERRIRIMTSPRVSRPWLRAAVFGAAAVATVVAACEAPGPVQPAPASVTVQPVRTETQSALVTIPSTSRINRADIEAAVREHYPDVLRAAAADTSSLLFVIAPDGRLERHERLRMKRLTAPRRSAAEAQGRWRQASGLTDRETASSVVNAVGFAPGQLGPGRVEVMWVRKFSEEQLTTTVETRRERVPAGETPFRTSTQPARGPQITAAQAREYVARYFPQIVRGGPAPESVWIVADASGRVVAHGDDGESRELNRAPDEIGNVQVFEGEDLVVNGHPVSLVYVRLRA